MTDPTEPPSPTTEQARDLASRWSYHHCETALTMANALTEWHRDDIPEVEREQLFAWVRARMRDCGMVPEPGAGCRVSLAAYVEAELDPGVLEGVDPFGFEPAWALCEAAGWPS